MSNMDLLAGIIMVIPQVDKMVVNVYRCIQKIKPHWEAVVL